MRQATRGPVRGARAATGFRCLVARTIVAEVRMGSFLLGAVKILLAVQATQATVAGTVRDEETGEPLAGAVVTLIDLDRATTTNADGRYVLQQVPPGPQHITFRFIG